MSSSSPAAWIWGACVFVVLALTSLIVLAPARLMAQQTDSTVVGDVRIYRSVDPMTDSAHTAVVAYGKIPDIDHLAGLKWDCSEGYVDLLFFSPIYLRGSERVPVRWRFDHDQPSDWDEWQPLPDGHEVIPGQDVADAFTSRSRTASRILLEAVDAQMDSHTYVFATSGLGKALAQLPCVQASVGSAP